MSSAYVPSKGGVERAVWELSTRFAAAGHKVTVVTSSRGKKPRVHMENTESIHIVRYPERFHFFEAPLIPEIAVRALSLHYDILHIHGMSPTITDLGIAFAKLRRKPVVLTYHNDIESDYGGRIGRVVRHVHQRLSAPIVGLSDVVVATTMSYGVSSPVLKDLKHRFTVIPMGVNPKKFASREAPPVEKKEKRLLFVGQLRDYKGVHVLLEALSELRHDGYSLSLDVVGSGPSAPKLKAQAQQLGVAEYAKFWGKVDDDSLLAFYTFADLVVLPSISRREAFGIVQLEAMAAGKPVVASDIPGVRDIALQGGGFLAKPGDVWSLKKAIVQGLTSTVDPVRLQNVASTHNWDRIASSYMELFTSLNPGN